MVPPVRSTATSIPIKSWRLTSTSPFWTSTYFVWAILRSTSATSYAHLIERSLRERRHPYGYFPAAAAFQGEYMRQCPNVTREDIELYTLLSLARHISLCATLPGRRHNAIRVLEYCEEMMQTRGRRARFPLPFNREDSLILAGHANLKKNLADSSLSWGSSLQTSRAVKSRSLRGITNVATCRYPRRVAAINREPN